MGVQPISRRMLRAKIHRAVVTDACLDYEGSLTLPLDLMEEADMREYESVCVWNVTRGSRFETYAISGSTRSRSVCVNGAAAHLAKPGDIIIVATFAEVPEPLLDDYRPKIIFVDSENRIVSCRAERPGPYKPELASHV